LALDAERRLPLRAGERPKEKRRIDGRSGDEPVTLREAPMSSSASTNRSAGGTSAAECLLRSG
jgi:hypothetical protein